MIDDLLNDNENNVRLPVFDIIMLLGHIENFMCFIYNVMILLGHNANSICATAHN